MTSDLATKTLQLALKKQKPEAGVILHSDQGVQYTSQHFVEFCSAHKVQQSMSRAGMPLDNAPMERFFNTLKHEFYYIFEFKNSEILDNKLYHFVNIKYNYQRPHTYTNGVPPLRMKQIA